MATSYQVTSDEIIFKFSRRNKPALTVPSGATVELETMDCFANQLRHPEDTLASMDWNRVNPATGPVFVEGAEPGDLLRVSIEEIKIDDQGVMATGKDEGTIGGRLKGLVSKIIPIKDGKAYFDQLGLPLSPMIGVIGVAPAEQELNCGTPGPHGGNMDNTMITADAAIYFPVFVKGALFALGDLHAVMGDGEIGVSGVEVAARVKVKLEVRKGLQLETPVLENRDSFSVIASAPTLDEAIDTATNYMATLLVERLPLELAEVAMLMSAVGQAQICQIVDPLRTARFVMPKWVLNHYNFKL